MNDIKVYLFWRKLSLNDGGEDSLTPEIAGMNDIKVYLFLAEIVSEGRRRLGPRFHLVHLGDCTLSPQVA